MPINVKDYLNSMKSIQTSVKTNVSKTSSTDLKTQQLVAQLIEAISYANSMKLSKKDLASTAKGINNDGKTTKEVVALLKSQESLIKQLINGQKLTKEQSKELNNSIDRFYEAVGSQEVNYKKFAASLEKFALKGDLPEAIQNRLINDSRDAHIIGKEQKNKEGILLPIVKKIRNLLEDTAISTKQFNKKLLTTLDSFREDFLEGLSELTSFDWLNDILKNAGKALSGLGMLFMGFQGMFKEGNFKWGQLFKQGANISKIFKVSKYGLKGLKKIPVLGTLVSLWMAKERWDKKDYSGALIELGSGFAALFPGIGTGISIALDLINLGKDTGFFEKAKTSVQSTFEHLGLETKMKIPLIGPIFGIIEGIKMWKSGNKKEALKLFGSALAGMSLPGAVMNVVSLVKELFDKSEDISGSTSLNAGGFGSTEAGELGSGDFASNLAQAAEDIGGHTTKSGGYCSRGVRLALTRVLGSKEAEHFRSGEAYEMAPKLARYGSKYFNMAGFANTNEDMKKIPKGSIAVWGKQKLHPHGHVEIADGKGNVISDFKRKADLNLYRKNPEGVRPLIFTPKGTSGISLSASRNATGQDETSSSNDGTIVDTTNGLDASMNTFDAMLEPFNQINQNIMGSIMKEVLPTLASITGQDNLQSSIGDLTGATQMKEASSGLINTLSSVYSSNKPDMQQTVQTVQAPSTPDTIDTEIKDTDLAILNSLLFQT